MKYKSLIFATGIVFVSFLLTLVSVVDRQSFGVCSTRAKVLSSPDGEQLVYFCFVDDRPGYGVRYQGRDVLAWSPLGIDVAAERATDAKPVEWSFREETRAEVDETWEQPWGEQRFVRNHYREMGLSFGANLAGQPGTVTLRFRAFDDGIGFRYELAGTNRERPVSVLAERTEFRLTGDHLTWAIAAYAPPAYEQLYERAQLTTQPKFLHTPLTVDGDGVWLAIHEAALANFSSMQLENLGRGELRAHLAPSAKGAPVKTTFPFQTPWRTIQITKRPGDLITSYLVLNLNEPNRLGDVSYARPFKFMGIWWGMHMGDLTWAPGAKLGATTERALARIDWAKKLGIPNLLIEGWNLGWEFWGDPDHKDFGRTRFDFVRSNSRFDIKRVAEYARSRGVKIVGHHETAGDVENYERQMDAALELYRTLGITSLKSGYVAEKIRGEYHYGQVMVDHYQRAVEAAHRYGITLNVHEPVKDTGLRRTYPNLMTREGMRGGEYDAWGGPIGNPPSHTVTLPFTRGLTSPMDYTPGIFRLLRGQKPGIDRVRTTLAKQLALYVVLYSPIQMVPDDPEAYDGHPAFRFIQDVPVDWETTIVPEGEVGKKLVVVRKDRNGPDWYVGAITDEEPRSISLKLDFLPKGPFCYQLYGDSKDSHWLDNPLTWEFEEGSLDGKAELPIRLAPGGGAAIRIHPCKSGG